MEKLKTTPLDIDHYISEFPAEVRERLETVRITIHKAAPKAEEVISYGMPAFKIQYILVYFAGYKKHVGFYPGALTIATFKKEIAAYKNAKGSVQFPHDEPLPLALITKMVKFKAKADLEKVKAKKK